MSERLTKALKDAEREKQATEERIRDLKAAQELRDWSKAALTLKVTREHKGRETVLGLPFDQNNALKAAVAQELRRQAEVLAARHDVVLEVDDVD